MGRAARDARYNASEKGRETRRRYAQNKRISDPVWAVTQDIKRVARRNLQRRRELNG